MKREASLIEKTFFGGVRKVTCAVFITELNTYRITVEAHLLVSRHTRKETGYTEDNYPGREVHLDSSFSFSSPVPGTFWVTRACTPTVFIWVSILFASFHVHVRMHVLTSCHQQPITDFRQRWHPTVTQTSVITDHEEAKCYTAADSGKRSRLGLVRRRWGHQIWEHPKMVLP